MLKSEGLMVIKWLFKATHAARSALLRNVTLCLLSLHHSYTLGKTLVKEKKKERERERERETMKTTSISVGMNK